MVRSRTGRMGRRSGGSSRGWGEGGSEGRGVSSAGGPVRDGCGELCRGRGSRAAGLGHTSDGELAPRCRSGRGVVSDTRDGGRPPTGSPRSSASGIGSVRSGEVLLTLISSATARDDLRLSHSPDSLSRCGRLPFRFPSRRSLASSCLASSFFHSASERRRFSSSTRLRTASACCCLSSRLPCAFFRASRWGVLLPPDLPLSPFAVSPAFPSSSRIPPTSLFFLPAHCSCTSSCLDPTPPLSLPSSFLLSSSSHLLLFSHTSLLLSSSSSSLLFSSPTILLSLSFRSTSSPLLLSSSFLLSSPLLLLSSSSLLSSSLLLSSSSLLFSSFLLSSSLL
eukprot:Sspe_Gene.78563::Locus_49150_Transcript_1_1_Confidence_1.000_Length_1590::g.78563::m.78563